MIGEDLSTTARILLGRARTNRFEAQLDARLVVNGCPFCDDAQCEDCKPPRVATGTIPIPFSS